MSKKVEDGLVFLGLLRISELSESVAPMNSAKPQIQHGLGMIWVNGVYKIQFHKVKVIETKQQKNS